MSDPTQYPTADDERATVRSVPVMRPRTALSRFWPVVLVLGLLLAAVIVVSQTRHCAPVSTVTYPTPEARERALQLGDTVPAAMQSGDLVAYEHVCTWGR